MKPIVGPETVPHYNNYASALINGGAAPGYSSGQAVTAMERAAAIALPRDFAFEWTGITYQELKAGSIAMVVFTLAIVFVFLILAAQYESWTMPFMVLFAVPLALFGAFLALFVRGLQTDVYSQIGFVMLIGLSAKNAILIVEFAKRRRQEGLSIVEAAMEAARLRLRPILMTAFAFILGVVPLMVASGAGAASRQSIGTTVFGGMLAATILTLLFVPVFYAVIEGLRERGHSTGNIASIRAEPRSGRINIRENRHATLGKSCSAAPPLSASARPFCLHVPVRTGRGCGSGGAASHAGAGDCRDQAHDPGLSRLFRADRIDPRGLAAGQGRRLHPVAARGRRRRREGERSALQDRRPRLSRDARSGQGAGAAQCRGARLCAFEFQSR